MKIRALAFASLFSLVLLGPLMLYVLEGPCGITVPPKISSEEASFLSGDSKVNEEPLSFSLHDIRSGAFQAAFERKIGSHIPFKSTALLGNALWQRTMIGLSDCLFDYECYPAYYGCTRLWLPAWSAATEQPLRLSDAIHDAIGAFAFGLDKVAREHPDINFHVLVPDQPATAPANPTHELLGGNTVTTETVHQQIAEDCTAPNVNVSTNAHDSLESYYAAYMKSDHHWNARGALEAANIFLENAGLPPMDDLAFTSLNSIDYSGYTARAALANAIDSPFDAKIDYSTVTISDGDIDIDGNDHSEYWDSTDEEKHWKFYESYWPYHTEFEGPGEGTALMVCDSAGNSIARLLALQYDVLDVRYDLHESTRDTAPLKDLISACHPDDVYIIGIPNDLLTFCSRNPGYFE